MDYFPVFLDLRNRPALVVGEGEAAARKAEALSRAGARVRRTPVFAPADLDGVAIAIGADAPEPALRALSAAAMARGIPVNVVDRPELCSYITPSIVDRSPIQVAVSSGGAAPVLARLLRARIEAMVPPAFGALAALAGRWKERIRAALPDTAQRRRVLERALSGRVAELALAGRAGEAEAELARAIEGAPEGGICYLVGAGPGAADLLTLRAQRLLGEADVIVHDRLVTQEVLDMARRDADRILVGKRRSQHTMAQEDINALLVRLCREGRKVVRLKGGDPYIFGRGGEETETLAAAGIPFEVVPGITAALACAAGAGIPLTHRDATQVVTFATGHQRGDALDLDFAWLARGGTLAIYMGLHTLPALRDGLLGAGLDPATPAALIERGGRPEQRVLRGTLDTLVAGAPGWETGGPTLLLVGRVVGR
jgi:uroporphyrin-III C-methyltransferase / precorrin-2 dehydrogenase / sirohydrochlorin ferrochelatase